MKQVIVRYRVKADRPDENVTAVRSVLAELARDKPAGLRYTTLRGADGRVARATSQLPDFLESTLTLMSHSHRALDVCSAGAA